MRKKRVDLIGNQRSRFLILLLLTPGIWWLVWHLHLLVVEWQKTPSYLKTKWSTVFSEQRLAPIEEFRWRAFGKERGSLQGRLFYNKLIVILDQFFDWTTFLLPRFYFQSGDGTQFSPPGIEPIPSLFFVFWVGGLADLIKKKDLKSIFIIFLSSLPGFVLGQKTMAFLFPVLLVYLYIANKGIGWAIKREKKLTLSLLTICFLYSLFLLGRMIYLVK